MRATKFLTGVTAKGWAMPFRPALPAYGLSPYGSSRSGIAIAMLCSATIAVAAVVQL